jgi:deoxyhypusine synthase
MSLSQGMEKLDKMIKWDLSKEDNEYTTQEARAQVECKVFLSYTSNMISSGVREYIKYKVVQAIVTLAGGIAEKWNVRNGI